MLRLHACRIPAALRISRAVVVFLCFSYLAPPLSIACGWGGDGESDDDDEASMAEVTQDPDASIYEAILDPTKQTEMGNRYRTARNETPDYAKAMS